MRDVTWPTLLVSVDDVLAFSHSPESIMKDIVLAFDIKGKNYGPPTTSLGANVEPFQMSDRKYAWGIKCDYCVVADVQMIKYLLSENNRELKSVKRPHKGPFPHGCKPNLDVTDDFFAKHVSQF